MTQVRSVGMGELATASRMFIGDDDGREDFTLCYAQLRGVSLDWFNFSSKKGAAHLAVLEAER